MDSRQQRKDCLSGVPVEIVTEKPIEEMKEHEKLSVQHWKVLQDGRPPFGTCELATTVL